MHKNKNIELAPDLLKSFGIALVVLGHVLRGLFSAHIVPEVGVWHELDRTIYLFHMPLFFYASGLFAESSVTKYGYRGFVRKTAWALLLPLVFWSYLQYTLQFVAGAVVNNPISLLEVIAAPFPPRQQFWFLGVLFMIATSVGLILRMPDRHRILWILTALLLLVQAVFWDLLVWLMAYNLVVFLFAQMFIHLPFFILGILLNTDKMRSVKIHTLLCLLVFVGSLWAYQSITVLGGFVHMIASVLCVLSLYKLALNITEGKTGREPAIFTFVFIGMNSMIIYLAHVIAAAGFRVVLSMLGIESIPLHLMGGFLAGFLGPLVLVPVGLRWVKRNPKWARAILPVRYERSAA